MTKNTRTPARSRIADHYAAATPVPLEDLTPDQERALGAWLDVLEADVSAIKAMVLNIATILDERDRSEAHSLVADGTPGIAPEPLLGSACSCDYAYRESEVHDELLARLRSDDIAAHFLLLEDAMLWEELYGNDSGKIGPWCWPKFAAQHNFADPAQVQRTVRLTRDVRMHYRAWRSITQEERDAIDHEETE